MQANAGEMVAEEVRLLYCDNMNIILNCDYRQFIKSVS